MIRAKYIWPYVILILTVVTLVYVNQKVVGDQLALSRKNDRGLNFSGRQRMLSQKLAKYSYQYYLSGVKPVSMAQDLDVWNRVHTGLLNGDTAFGMTSLKYAGIKKMIVTLDPVQRKLSGLYAEALVAPPSRALLDSIAATEPVFLKNMDELVFALSHAADKEIDDTEATARMLVVASGVLVILEILLIVLPYNRRLIRANTEIKRQKLEILKREEEQQDTNHRYELTIMGSDAGIWYANLHTGSITWTSKFYELLGYVPDEFPPNREFFTNQMLHPEDKDALLAARENHLKNHTPFRIECRLKMKNGTYRWFEITAQADWDITGVPVKLAGSITDVEERVANRRQLEYEGYLLEEAGRMAKIGGWYYEGETKQVTWTDAVYQIFEADKDDSEIMWDRNKRYPEEYRAAIRKATEEVLTQKKSFSFVAEIFTAKGGRKWVHVLGQPVENQYGIVTGIRGVFQDIDEQKKREMELEQTRQNLQDINKSKDKIFSIIAHDLKSPVATLETLLSLYNKSKASPEMVDKYVASMQRTTRNLINTMDNMFNWANSQMNGLVKNIERLDLKEIVGMTVALYEESMHQKGIKLQDITVSLFAYADKEHCFLIIRNLVNNAVKFTGRGGIISIDTERSGSMVRVNIRDTGVGIDKAIVDQIKQGKINESTKGTDGETGSGLGLSLSLEVAKENNGMIQVNSVAGKGSTFSLLLPAFID